MAKNLSDKDLKLLSRTNGQINNMSYDELKENMKKFELNDKGNKEILKRRLKEHYKNSNSILANKSSIKRKCPRYLIVIDFEATCEENDNTFVHEIIEFPAILVDTVTNTIIDEFHSFVRPVLNPFLTEFCTNLTGITQEVVDDSSTFPEVFERWKKWLLQKQLKHVNKFAIVTDGPWDMDRFLWGQCCLSEIEMPKFCQRWINIRKLFAAAYKSQRTNIAGMLEAFEMEFEGTPHCGLHDARNIARILIVMLNDGIIPQINENIRVSHKRLLDEIVAATKSPHLTDKSKINRINVEQLDEAQNEAEKFTSDSSDDEEKDISDLLRYVSLQNS